MPGPSGALAYSLTLGGLRASSDGRGDSAQARALQVDRGMGGVGQCGKLAILLRPIARPAPPFKASAQMAGCPGEVVVRRYAVRPLCDSNHGRAEGRPTNELT